MNSIATTSTAVSTTTTTTVSSINIALFALLIPLILLLLQLLLLPFNGIGMIDVVNDNHSLLLKVGEADGGLLDLTTFYEFLARRC